MKQRIRSILANLDNLITDLRELSDDIWLNIDNNDSEAAQRGLDFKVKYNDIFQRFSGDINEMRDLIQNFNQSCLTEVATDQKTQTRLILEIDKEVPHTLEENFTYKRPFGFKLQGVPFVNTTSWLQVYETICKSLSKKNSSLCQMIPDNSEFISNRGNKYFSRKPDELRSGREFETGIFAEINLSANQIRDCIKRLLNYFSIPEKELELFFR
jgi:hypothetical protein